MTPDQFFDELDKMFGSDDGYIKHLERIKKLKQERNLFEVEFHKTLECQAEEEEKYEKEIKKLKEKLEFTQKVKEDYFNTIKWKNDMIVDLEKENQDIKEVIDNSKEWLKLCENDIGNIQNYDLRQLDTRIRPERYN